MAVAIEIAETSPRRRYGRHDRLVPLKSGGDIPGYTDKRWFIWTRPLKCFICQPRTWKELNNWAYANKVAACITRDLLAWLEMSGEAEFDSTSRTWRGKNRIQSITERVVRKIKS